jgi:hypothetical protein
VYVLFLLISRKLNALCFIVIVAAKKLSAVLDEYLLGYFNIVFVVLGKKLEVLLLFILHCM